MKKALFSSSSTANTCLMEHELPASPSLNWSLSCDGKWSAIKWSCLVLVSFSSLVTQFLRI